MRPAKYNLILKVLDGIPVPNEVAEIYTTVESYGQSFSDLMSNAIVFSENEHGKQLPFIHVSDLKERYYVAVEEAMQEAIDQADDLAYDEAN